MAGMVQARCGYDGAMHAPEQPILRDIVLIGGGHSHVGVLRRFGMRPEPGVRLTLICTDAHTPYSGMLPGYIAGHYSYDDVHIDLARLAVFAGARFYRDEVVGIDRAAGRCCAATGRRCRTTWRRSTPAPRRRWRACPVRPRMRCRSSPSTSSTSAGWPCCSACAPMRARTTIAVVGGGAGGVELTLAMQYRLRRELQALGRNPDELVFHLFTATRTSCPRTTRVRARFDARAGAARRAGAHPGRGAQVTAGHLHHRTARPWRPTRSSGSRRPAARLAAQARAWRWTTTAFVRVNDPAAVVSDPRIFAAGDVAALVEPRALEKAGVFAVRMGAPLADNLRRSARGEPLRPYRPQRHWLALISTGDRYAVASRGQPLGLRFGATGSGAGRTGSTAASCALRSVPVHGRRAARPPPPALVLLTAEESQQAISAHRHALRRLRRQGGRLGAVARTGRRCIPVDRDDVLIGLHAPDDAAVVRVPPGKALVHTVDFFRAFIDDPYLFGKVAANHALGDIFAMGAEPQSATADGHGAAGAGSQGRGSAVPDDDRRGRGAECRRLRAGGRPHRRGQELALGFAVNGLVDDELQGRAAQGRHAAGDALMLTKPLGTGTLFAAHARLAARGRWIEAALQSMVQSNQRGAQLLLAHGATACTDLTGFGLLGHLVEMTRPSGVDAELALSALPLLDGARECVAQGITSSLQPANVRLRRALRNQAFVNTRATRCCSTRRPPAACWPACRRTAGRAAWPRCDRRATRTRPSSAASWPAARRWSPSS
jgi:selenide,water dikinase